MSRLQEPLRQVRQNREGEREMAAQKRTSDRKLAGKKPNGHHMVLALAKLQNRGPKDMMALSSRSRMRKST